MKSVTIHSDGACEGNPGPGGWAAVLQYGTQRKEISGGEAATTNNRMELMGAIEGLKALKEACEVEFYTDSEYLRQGITEWVAMWKRFAWKTKAKEPVKNKELWIDLDQLAAKHTITWKWLKGHAGHAENERCDVLARGAIAELRKKFTKDELREKLAEFKAAQEKKPEDAAQSKLFA